MTITAANAGSGTQIRLRAAVYRRQSGFGRRGAWPVARVRSRSGRLEIRVEDLIQFVPFILIFGIMYFLIIRPQEQERSAHEALIKGLQKDDRVVLASGLHGRVVRVDEHTFELDVGMKKALVFDKNAVKVKLTDAS